MPISLNGSRRVRDIESLEEGESRTVYSLLDVYAKRHDYDNSQDVHSMNFVPFASMYNIVNNELTKTPDNVIPRIFPIFSSNPKGQNFGLYCKYQLLRYKLWGTTRNNDQAPTTTGYSRGVDDIRSSHSI